MNDCPRRYTQKRLIGQCHFFIKPVGVSWRVFATRDGRDGCRYTENCRSVSLLRKTRQCKLAGFSRRSGRMDADCHDAIPESGLSVRFHFFFIKPASAGFLL
ncbi:hypothetical protein KCP70_07740 [Salmonella enterica subsp. enterica]|nr:hypothetical protein KCP70_07740 [Salmonella enterica subsp. enterica]